MTRAIFVSNISKHIRSAYSNEAKATIRKYYDLDEEIVSRGNIEEMKAKTQEAEVIFTTWGMPHFTKEEIKAYFPNVKCVYYAAGSVQDFAREFLESGVRVFSAASANAIPVSEYTVAMIMLANKMAPRAIKDTSFMYYQTQKVVTDCRGNYKTRVGIIGAGKIGSMVSTKLHSIMDVEVLAYDPFLSDERAKAINVRKVSLEELFSEADVITNHLANKKELEGILNYDLFKLMKDKSTFINSGRGKQVDEKGLVKALKENKSRSAILDVTFPEPTKVFSPLRHMKNVFLTPHIAGSLGGEIARMGDYMVSDMQKVVANEAPENEVTLDMLKLMA